MKLVIALGNPGSKYEKTRHNAGFIVMEKLAEIYNLKFKNEPKFQSYISIASPHLQVSTSIVSPPLQEETFIVSPPYQGGVRGGKSLDKLTKPPLTPPYKGGETKIIFVMPLTYMNESGIATSRLATFYKIPPQNIIIIHDELDLPLGKLRISFGSSAGGHNGIKSIISSISTKDFIRVRVGIGNEISESRKIPSEKFVLQNFSSDEQKTFLSNLQQYTDAVDMILKEGYEKAMGEFN